MASKTLTANVRFNTTQADRALKRLSKQIATINRELNKTKANNLTKQLQKSTSQADKLQKKVGKLNTALNKTKTSANQVSTALNKATTKTNQATSNTHRWSNAQKQVANFAKSTNSHYRTGNGLLGSMVSKLKMLAATYLGIMGAKAVITTTDTMTGAQNRLNYSHSTINGDDVAKNGYSEKTYKATQEAMDKMYNSSQKVRMSYTDMMSNVGKFMALAPDAFQNSTDNAIRFQEIMAEAYAVGGASAAEMSSSMYQLTQALGAGILAGDELRSVREGAPLAYKEIEKFAQGVYDTDESLKELASQGKITSDMVVAAIMNAGGKLDTAFAQTEQTFAQTWEQIKNTAKKSFEPVATSLRDAINRAVDNGLMDKIESFFTTVSKVLQITFKVISLTVQWIADNWETIKSILLPALITLGLMLAASALIAVANFIIVNKWIIFIGYAIFTIIKPIYDFLTGVKTLSEAISEHLWMVGIGLLILAVMTGNWWIALAGAIVLTLWAIWRWFEYVAGGVTWLGILFKNIGLEIANFFIALSWVIANAFMTAVEFVVDIFNGCVSWIVALFWGCVNTVGNFFVGLGKTISGIATNIGIAFSNAWNGALSDFWNFIASCTEGLDWLSKPLEAIAKLFGKSFDYASFTENLRNKAEGYSAKQKEYVEWNYMHDISAFEDGWSGKAWNQGTSNWEAPKWDEDSSWKEKINTLDAFEKGWGKDAFDIGYNWGVGVKDGLDNWGSGAQDWFADKMDGSFLDKLGEKLGLDFNNELTNPVGGVGDSYNFPTNEELLAGVDGIGDDTSKIKDAMDLADDDLEYLRKLAEMEWRNEFTTAEIKVDMTNHNTVNGDRDLDGIVSYLSDVLREEMTNVAYGVHY